MRLPLVFLLTGCHVGRPVSQRPPPQTPPMCTSGSPAWMVAPGPNRVYGHFVATIRRWSIFCLGSQQGAAQGGALLLPHLMTSFW